MPRPYPVCGTPIPAAPFSSPHVECVTASAGSGNLADTMIAATQASLDTEVTTSLLDKAVTSYNDIMNMSF